MNCLFRGKNDLFSKHHFTNYWLSGCSMNLERDLKAGVGIDDDINFEIHLYLIFIK